MQEAKIQILSQLIKTIEDSASVLEGAYLKKDFEKFNSAKRLILELQNKIQETISRG